MAKLDIKKFDELQSKLQTVTDKIEVIVSLGTCGIAAGGDSVYEYFKSELPKRTITNVLLKKTGCLGLCSMEPNVEIKLPNHQPILYGNVTREVAEQILNQHICQGSIVSKYVISMPSTDIVKGEH